jgi:nucleotide-binding universal stress UspA family protein
MTNILVPVDGSESASRAVEAAIQAYGLHSDATVHLITVHPPIVSGNVKRFFSADVLQDYYNDEGNTALQPAKALLDKAGVKYTENIVVGPIAESIVDYSKQHNCSYIVMGSRGLGSITGMVLGSVATKVLNLVNIPVTLVK